MQAVNYVGSTIKAALSVPVSVFYAAKNAGTTAIGVAGSAVSVATAGMWKGMNDVAAWTQNGHSVLPTLYIAVAKVINPSFETTKASVKTSLITNAVAKPILDKALASAASENAVVRHVVSRAAFLGHLVASVATRVADLAIGVLAAGISIIPCLARVTAVNTLAVRQLSSLGGIVHDVCRDVRGIVNPQQFLQPVQI